MNDDDGVMLDMYTCCTCKNQFWLEAFDGELNNPYCCPACGEIFDGVEETDEER
jgi:hypothetical protein